MKKMVYIFLFLIYGSSAMSFSLKNEFINLMDYPFSQELSAKLIINFEPKIYLINQTIELLSKIDAEPSVKNISDSTKKIVTIISEISEVQQDCNQQDIQILNGIILGLEKILSDLEQIYALISLGYSPIEVIYELKKEDFSGNWGCVNI